jgi:hypothetical protein
MGFTIWQYWEGPMPPYVQLCIETVRKHHPDAQLLDREAFDAMFAIDQDVPLDHLRAEHRADFVRAWLLRHRTGAWLDCDFVLLRPLDRLFEQPESITFVGYRPNESQFMNNLMYSREGDPVVSQFYDFVVDHLRNRRPIDWLELGALPLTTAAEAHATSVAIIPTDLVCPIQWFDVGRFEEPGDASRLASSPRYGVMLANASVSDTLRSTERADVLASDTLLGDLLRRALG